MEAVIFKYIKKCYCKAIIFKYIKKCYCEAIKRKLF